ncbi:alpha-(1-_3)-arabinofuranosyltransferase domain-containing protein [Candidatus Frankia nodulisporulans]|uniref:alpha-(1->3)-arabinofuranosyltransferase domain-containing protein n=2 Tax=Candidatus Frankia nodulisporulans TaxID=2060052 RepID=UPI0015831FF7|nr:alpha-(1->3)-arabinofuranosyltransferase family protein [Candidatus Frankia nodulisporulans]
MRQASVSIVVPAFNEAARLPRSLPVLVGALRRHHLADAEVIVVDDGSVDDTARLAARLLGDAPNRRVLRLPVNQGKGAAVRAGVAAATGDVIAFMDADLASDVDDLPRLLNALGNAEVALGSRRLANSAERAPVRRLGSWLFHLVVRLLVRLDVADTQCGFKAFRHAEAKLLFARTRLTGFAFDVEVLALARALGYRMAEVPVRWVEQPGGRFHALTHTPMMLVELTRVRRHVRRAGREMLTAASAIRTSPAPARSFVPVAPSRTSRRALLWIALGHVLLFVSQAPGRLTADTKLPLAVSPARFLAAATRMWDSTADFGAVPNQAYGYLFPMGPFFLAGHLTGLPVWLVQRLWMALLLTVAAWGVVRLADALGIGAPTGRILGGLGYALSPMFLGKIGATSAAVLGAAMLPWIVTPLVRALYAESPVRTGPCDGQPTSRRVAAHALTSDGWLSPRRAAARSGLAVLCVGGINASVAVDVLVVPAMLLLLAGGSRRAWAVRGWWVAAVGAAIAWWAMGLLAVGRYGLNFVPFTETADLTTASASLPEALRAATDWMAYLRVPSVWLPSAADYAGSRVVIAGTYALTAIGVWGLSRRDLPARRFLVLCFALGTVVIVAGYPGALGGPASADVRALLDGQLSPLRNIAKFQAVTHLPMALGLTHAAGLTTAAAGRRLSSRSRRGPRPWFSPSPSPSISASASASASPRPAAALLVLTVTALVASTLPVLRGQVLQPGSFRAVPAYWEQAADWLTDHPDNGRTLLLPGAPFAQYDWGRPLDEPMRWLSSTPWGERSLIPLGGVGLTRWLDAVETSLSGDGRGLGVALARAGVGQVLVRNDLADSNWDVPPSTDEIHQALMAGGLRPAATFGPLVVGRAGNRERVLPVNRRRPIGQAPALEVWTVPGGARQVQAYPAGDALVVAGGPEAAVTLAAHGLLPPDRAMILAEDLGDPRAASTGKPGTVAASAPLTPPTTVLSATTGLAITDTLTRRDQSFGVVHSSPSYLLGPDEWAAGATRAPREWTDRPPAGHQTVGGYLDGKSVTASSYGYLLRAAPELGPASAVDGLPHTWWTARPDLRTGSEGAWLRVDVGTPLRVPYLVIALLAETPRRPVARTITVTSAAGSVDTSVTATDHPQYLAVPAGPSSWYQVTLRDVTRGDGELLGAGIRELAVPGQGFVHYAQAPTDATALFAADPSTDPPGRTVPAGPVLVAFDRTRENITEPFSVSEEQLIVRRFTVPRAMSFTLDGTVTALPESGHGAQTRRLAWLGVRPGPGPGPGRRPLPAAGRGHHLRRRRRPTAALHRLHPGRNRAADRRRPPAARGPRRLPAAARRHDHPGRRCQPQPQPRDRGRDRVQDRVPDRACGWDRGGGW